VDVPLSKLEGQPPVSVHPNRPTAPAEAFELMKPQPRDVNVFDHVGGVESGEKHPQSFRMVWLDASRNSNREELPQSLVLD
jgi:hypothetical protein